MPARRRRGAIGALGSGLLLALACFLKFSVVLSLLFWLFSRR